MQHLFLRRGKRGLSFSKGSELKNAICNFVRVSLESSAGEYDFDCNLNDFNFLECEKSFPVQVVLFA
jgi:hypothetical protein